MEKKQNVNLIGRSASFVLFNMTPLKCVVTSDMHFSFDSVKCLFMRNYLIKSYLNCSFRISATTLSLFLFCHVTSGSA